MPKAKKSISLASLQRFGHLGWKSSGLGRESAHRHGRTAARPNATVAACLNPLQGQGRAVASLVTASFKISQLFRGVWDVVESAGRGAFNIPEWKNP